MKLDAIDIKLLKLLQEDATLNNKQLSLELHLSIAAVHERVKKLRANEYIKKTVVLLDRHKLRLSLISFSQVFLKAHTFEVLQEFEKEVVKLPEVMECYQIAGSYDFLLRIVTEDMDAYNLFLRHKLSLLPHVNTVHSYFALSEVKSVTAFPLE
ncbi:Lrp/AsnC family transcriptional regulator [Chryseobacterium sp. c4a]|uniref:Lrp/AsnC family transcriptional regulator n=1 Tax=Chryseobacterium sp. c4a TaxID=1573582 RepID=UPI0013571777|nr:Lrp/AsnC family transcriptional regulator [Chryseobacterium sp. c4a]